MEATEVDHVEEKSVGRQGRAYYFSKRPAEEEVARLEYDLPNQNRKTAINKRNGLWCVEVTWDPS
jgi:hypothetical protein